MGKRKGVCRECKHAESTSVWDQYWCTREDSSYYDCRRNGDEYCKVFEEKEIMDKRCENCKWRSDEFTSVCVNDESDHLADFVEAGGTCDYWEEMTDAVRDWRSKTPIIGHTELCVVTAKNDRI